MRPRQPGGEAARRAYPAPLYGHPIVTGLHRTMSAVTSRDVMRGMPSGLAVTGTKVTAHYAAAQACLVGTCLRRPEDRAALFGLRIANRSRATMSLSANRRRGRARTRMGRRQN